MAEENQPLEDNIHFLLVGEDGEVKVDSHIKDLQEKESEEDNGK